MAANPAPAGYPRDIFENIDSKYLCGICKLILKNPIQSFCGHRFCQDCFRYLIENSSDAELICVLCKLEDTVTEYSKLSLEQTFPDNALKREFLKLSARCTYPGCSWSGSFKDFEVHFATCEFLPASQSEGAQHQLGDKSVAEVYHDLYTRLTSSERFIGELSYRADKVEQDIRRLESVVASEISSSSSGATAAGAIASAASSELDTTPVKEIEAKTEILERIITILGRELEAYSGQTLASERQSQLFHDSVVGVGQKSAELEQAMVAKDKAIADVEKRINTLDETSYTGILLWKITNFKQSRLDALNGRTASIYSPAFWTGRTGYKMCARIYLNGDGMGKGTHVSLFFVIMRGQYDAVLRWPFRQKVTLMFLDQNNREHVTDSFRPDPTSSSFKRPTNEMNIASGCPLFMPVSMLDSGLHAYVRDDTAFVKVIVSIDGLD